MKGIIKMMSVINIAACFTSFVLLFTPSYADVAEQEQHTYGKVDYPTIYLLGSFQKTQYEDGISSTPYWYEDLVACNPDQNQVDNVVNYSCNAKNMFKDNPFYSMPDNMMPSKKRTLNFLAQSTSYLYVLGMLHDSRWSEVLFNGTAASNYLSAVPSLDSNDVKRGEIIIYRIPKLAMTSSFDKVEISEPITDDTINKAYYRTSGILLRPYWRANRSISGSSVIAFDAVNQGVAYAICETGDIHVYAGKTKSDPLARGSLITDMQIMSYPGISSSCSTANLNFIKIQSEANQPLRLAYNITFMTDTAEQDSISEMVHIDFDKESFFTPIRSKVNRADAGTDNPYDNERSTQYFAAMYANNPFSMIALVKRGIYSPAARDISDPAYEFGQYYIRDGGEITTEITYWYRNTRDGLAELYGFTRAELETWGMHEHINYYMNSNNYYMNYNNGFYDLSFLPNRYDDALGPVVDMYFPILDGSGVKHAQRQPVKIRIAGKQYTLRSDSAVNDDIWGRKDEFFIESSKINGRYEILGIDSINHNIIYRRVSLPEPSGDQTSLKNTWEAQFDRFFILPTQKINGVPLSRESYGYEQPVKLVLHDVVADTHLSDYTRRYSRSSIKVDFNIDDIKRLSDSFNVTINKIMQALFEETLAVKDVDLSLLEKQLNNAKVAFPNNQYYLDSMQQSLDMLKSFDTLKARLLADSNAIRDGLDPISSRRNTVPVSLSWSDQRDQLQSAEVTYKLIQSHIESDQDYGSFLSYLNEHPTIMSTVKDKRFCIALDEAGQCSIISLEYINDASQSVTKDMEKLWDIELADSAKEFKFTLSDPVIVMTQEEAESLYNFTMELKKSIGQAGRTGNYSMDWNQVFAQFVKVYTDPMYQPYLFLDSQIQQMRSLKAAAQESLASVLNGMSFSFKFGTPAPVPVEIYAGAGGQSDQAENATLLSVADSFNYGVLEQNYTLVDLLQTVWDELGKSETTAEFISEMRQALKDAGVDLSLGQSIYAADNSQDNEQVCANRFAQQYFIKQILPGLASALEGSDLAWIMDDMTQAVANNNNRRLLGIPSVGPAMAACVANPLACVIAAVIITVGLELSMNDSDTNPSIAYRYGEPDDDGWPSTLPGFACNGLGYVLGQFSVNHHDGDSALIVRNGRAVRELPSSEVTEGLIQGVISNLRAEDWPRFLENGLQLSSVSQEIQTAQRESQTSGRSYITFPIQQLQNQQIEGSGLELIPGVLAERIGGYIIASTNMRIKLPEIQRIPPRIHLAPPKKKSDPRCKIELEDNIGINIAFPNTSMHYIDAIIKCDNKDISREMVSMQLIQVLADLRFINENTRMVENKVSVDLKTIPVDFWPKE